MKKSHLSLQGSLLLFFAILCSACVQRAQADETPVNLFTGTFSVRFYGQRAGFNTVGLGTVDHSNQNNSDGFVLFGSDVAGTLNTYPIVGNFSDDHRCDNNAPPCTEHWSGTFNGGNISLTAFDSNGHQWSFEGPITGGSFSGYVSEGGNGSPFILDGHNTQTFNFTSTWTNGWTSEGILTAYSCVGDFCGSLGDPVSVGTLTMTTVAPTPEPASMMLVGLGIIVVAFLLRRNMFVPRPDCRPS